MASSPEDTSSAVIASLVCPLWRWRTSPAPTDGPKEGVLFSFITVAAVATTATHLGEGEFCCCSWEGALRELLPRFRAASCG